MKRTWMWPVVLGGLTCIGPGGCSGSTTSDSGTSSGGSESATGSASSAGASSGQAASSGQSSGQSAGTGSGQRSSSASSGSSSAGPSTGASTSASASSGATSGQGTRSGGSSAGATGTGANSSGGGSGSSGEASATAGSGTAGTTGSGTGTGTTGARDPLAIANFVTSESLQEFDDCTRAYASALPAGSPGNCQPPLVCRRDGAVAAHSASGFVCEFPCAQSTDCPDPATICAAGFCVYNGCDPADAGQDPLPQNQRATLAGPCDSLDAGDGTCLLEPRNNGYFHANPFNGNANSYNFQSPLRVCVRPGSAGDGGCLPPQGGSTPATTCAQAYTCAAAALPVDVPEANFYGNTYVAPNGDVLGGYGPQTGLGNLNPFVGSCLPACNVYPTPDSGPLPVVGCGGGSCIYPLVGGSGACAPVAGAATPGLPTLEYAWCGVIPSGGSLQAQPELCGSPLQCNSNNSLGGGFLCQAPCAADADCPSLADVCNLGTGFCEPNGCGGASTFGGCDAGGQPGTCYPVTITNPTTSPPYSPQDLAACVPNGTASGACSLQRAAPSTCPAGSGCLAGECDPLCNNPGVQTCETGLACTAYAPTPSNFDGLCATSCLGAQAPCGSNADCCSGGCNGGYCLACVGVTGGCSADGQCCSGHCLDGTCHFQTCLQDLASCLKASDCCGGHCVAGNCSSSTCNSAGGACQLASDCCSSAPYCEAGSCSTMNCLPNQQSCTDNTQCCSGNCYGGLCESATCLKPSDTGSCATNADCCSQQCDTTQTPPLCACSGTFSFCHNNWECCSASCTSFSCD